MARKMFCEINPMCYAISVEKEIIKRKIKNATSKEQFAKEKSEELLPNVVKEHSSILLRKLNNVDMTLQENKVTNIQLACNKINKVVVNPGETFSLWTTVGSTSKRKGYKEGLVIKSTGVSSGCGGGLCQMANMIHWLVLNSPLEVTELHHHSDALFPDERRRVPFGTGTSVSYNYLDYRFKNTTDQKVQIVVWIEDGELRGELRSEKEFPYEYDLVEKNHHFRKEGDDYYRVSQVYRNVIDRTTKKTQKRELILDNYSLVMYDHGLIPQEQIRTYMRDCTEGALRFKCRTCDQLIEMKKDVKPLFSNWAYNECIEWSDFDQEVPGITQDKWERSSTTPAQNEKRLVLVRKPFDEQVGNEFWVLFQPALLFFNGWDESPEEDICKCAMVRCRFERILEADEFSGWIELSILEVIPLEELISHYNESISTEPIIYTSKEVPYTDDIFENDKWYVFGWSAQGDVGETRWIYKDSDGKQHLVMENKWGLDEDVLYVGNLVDKE